MNRQFTIAYFDTDGQFQGVVGRKSYHKTKGDAERIAEKWRKSHSYKHDYRVVEIIDGIAVEVKS